ncbi:MAG: hypothetical protein RLZZ618_505 [Pseudomonadota bacterium]|jgi:hypothetical protein
MALRQPHQRRSGIGIGMAVLAFALLGSSAHATEPVLSPNAPRDKPTSLNDTKALERAIAPIVARARASYPEGRQKFLNGLPRGESFFVVTRLRDAGGREEQVFIAVQRIEGSRITGLIWNQVQRVQGYRYRDVYTFDDKQLIDWMISKPDGTEEGNEVGKFLDTYRGPGR